MDATILFFILLMFSFHINNKDFLKKKKKSIGAVYQEVSLHLIHTKLLNHNKFWLRTCYSQASILHKKNP